MPPRRHLRKPIGPFNATVKGIDKGDKAARLLKDAIGAASQKSKEKSRDMKDDPIDDADKDKGKVEEPVGENKAGNGGI
ncbi:hypothetical protein VN97_g12994 [Penicillium thymicola]|uniref:Uncharacterized protein n=1 Tax=Penicillium thymicola TaxID=293382 RepID=A0AAI9T5F4_PENTH|nr:hypothetical protein VN97_g12994 [Penicillium thymicola]